MDYRGGNYLRLNKRKMDKAAKNLRERSSMEERIVENWSFIVSVGSFPGCRLSQPPRERTANPLFLNQTFSVGFTVVFIMLLGFVSRNTQLFPKKGCATSYFRWEHFLTKISNALSTPARLVTDRETYCSCRFWLWNQLPRQTELRSLRSAE